MVRDSPSENGISSSQGVAQAEEEGGGVGVDLRKFQRRLKSDARLTKPLSANAMQVE